MTNKEALKRQAAAAGFKLTEDTPIGSKDMVYTFTRTDPAMSYDCVGSRLARTYLDGILAGGEKRRKKVEK